MRMTPPRFIYGTKNPDPKVRTFQNTVLSARGIALPPRFRGLAQRALPPRFRGLAQRALTPRQRAAVKSACRRASEPPSGQRAAVKSACRLASEPPSGQRAARVSGPPPRAAQHLINKTSCARKRLRRPLPARQGQRSSPRKRRR